MKRIALFLVLIVGLAASPVARSQQPATKPLAAKPVRTAGDSVDFKLSPDLKKSLDGLAASVQALAARIASDPQIRSAALQVASGVVTTAHQVVTEQSVAIQSALKTAAERISSVQPAPHSSAKKP